MVNNVAAPFKLSKETEDFIKDTAEMLRSNGVPMPVFLKALDEHFDEIFTDGPTKRIQKARDELIAQIEYLSESQLKRFLILAEEQGLLVHKWSGDGYYWCIPPL